jgi:NitT/TauT family transport system substrate-binding protein
MNVYLKSVTGLVAAACLSLTCLAAVPAKADDSVKGDGGPVRLLFSEFGTNSYIPFVIKKFDLDKKHNIQIVPTPTASTTTGLLAMQGGAADVGNFGWNEIARFIKGGYSLTAVTPWLRWGADFYVVPSDSSIKNAGDLKGKKVGVISKTALNYVLMRVVAKRDYNVDLDKEAEVHEGAPALLRGLIEQGQLDAVGIYNSVTPSMVATGKFKVLYKISDLIKEYGLPDTPFLMYAVDSKYAAAHPDNVKAFVQVYEDAINILETNDDVWIERGRQLQYPDEVSVLFRDAARTDLMVKFEPDTEKKVRDIFTQFLPLAGVEAFGIDSLPDGFMTLQYQ